MRKTVFLSLALLLIVTACASLGMDGSGGQENPPTGTQDTATGSTDSAASNNTVAQAQVQATITPFPTAEAAARPTYVVQRGTVQSVLEFNARWLPRDQYQLSFVINGTIRSVNVRRNDTVQAGDVLADYQIEELENQLITQELQLETALYNLQSGGENSTDPVVNAQIALANARLSLESKKDSLNWTSVASAKIQVDQAKKDLEDAQRDYDDVIGQADSPPSAVDSAFRRLEDARVAVTQAELSYFGAAQSYQNSLDSLIIDENNLIRCELDLEAAESGTGASFEQVQSVRTAQIAVDQTKEKIEQSTLYAPVAGVVLSVDIVPGDQVSAFNTVITLAIPDPKEVVAEGLAFNDIQKLSAGDIGECRLGNQPEIGSECLIRDLPLSSSEADQTVRIAATLPEATLGQGITVKMPLETREDVLWLPPGLVRTFQNRTFVIVQREDGEFVQDVVVGLRTDDREEIVSGLEEGDIVVAP